MAVENVYIFVDNSNLWIEGKRLTGSGGKENSSYRVDYGRLWSVIIGARMPQGVPKLYGSEPPPNDSVWKKIEKQGFDVEVFKRNIRGKEKGLDMRMGLDIQRLVLREAVVAETIAVVTGDADFVPVIEEVQREGWKTEVWYWPKAAIDLKNAADVFHALDPYEIGFDASGSYPMP